MAMCQAAKEAAWLTGPLEDFGLDLRYPLATLGNNQGPHTLIQNRSSTHARSILPSSNTSLASTVKCISTKSYGA